MCTDWSFALLRDFQEARKTLHISQDSSSRVTQPRWIPPPVNQLRLEVDAAYNENSNCYAIGRVIRDHDGNIQIAFGRKISKPQSVIYSELLAIREGIHVVRERDLVIHEIVSDSLLAVQAVTAHEEDLSYTGVLAADIKELLDNFNHVRLRLVRRLANVVAHSVAKFAIFSPYPFVWAQGNLPIWLVNLVMDDLRHSDQ